ncbi:MAG: FAD-dependent oxidoreductase [Vicinamibacterales bacterium]
MSQTSARVLVLLAVLAVVTAFVALDLGRFASLAALKAQQGAIDAYREAHPWRAAGIFFGVYVLMAATSLPGAAVLTVAGGAIFGVARGVLLVSFASAIGATLAFLVARFLFRDAVQRRFARRLAAVNRGVEREGAAYLLALRLVPVVPFFVVNLLMGLTPMAAPTFYGVSQLGMLPGTLVYVNAGTELARLGSLGDVLSPSLLLSFAAIGVLPLLARRVVAAARARAAYAPYAHLRPAVFENNVVVIGAGSAGLVAAYIAAAVKATVTLVERDRMGGDCLNTGCVPSKALLRAAALAAEVRRAPAFGVGTSPPDIDFGAVMARVRAAIAEVAPHDSEARYTALGVTCLRGDARLSSPWTVEVTGADGRTRTLTSRTIIIAAGARPVMPAIPGLAEAGALTSDTVWGLRERPRRLVVLGGGPIGCELAQAFARLGSSVTLVEMGPRLLPREDPECAAALQAALAADGVDVKVGHTAVRVETAPDGGRRLVVEHGGVEDALAFDEAIAAVGRVANTTGYGLDELGIEVTPARTIGVDPFMATRFPNIFACGDVAGPYQFTHTAAHTAWYAAVNALFGRYRSFEVDYSVVPWATFTDPEVARVGLNEQDARAAGVAHAITRYDLADLDRAITDGEAHGFVKVLTVPGSDRILGATIVGARAAELLPEFVTAMKHGLGLNAILGTIHVYPTMGEAAKYAAGAWKRATVTRGQEAFLTAFHLWRRGAGGFGHVVAALPGLIRDRRPAAAGRLHGE